MPLSEHIQGALTHRMHVGTRLLEGAQDLMQRALIHDDSKFSPQELDAFEEATPRLKKLKYGSKAYMEQLHAPGLQAALAHHYHVNPHHPEYHEQGIAGMNLFDLYEMLCDWMAAIQRTQDGDIAKSLEINKKRFGIDDQLYAILKQTIDDMCSPDW